MEYSEARSRRLTAAPSAFRRITIPVVTREKLAGTKKIRTCRPDKTFTFLKKALKFSAVNVKAQFELQWQRFGGREDQEDCESVARLCVRDIRNNQRLLTLEKRRQKTQVLSISSQKGSWL